MKITVENLNKVYKDKVVLDSLNFEIEGPSIIGFLGHNGAGKTTFLNILASLIPATSGKILVDGEELFDHPSKMNKICFVAESDNFLSQLSIDQVFKSNQLFYDNWDQHYAEQLLSKFRLNKKMRVKKLSKGMVSALGIIIGLAARTPIVIFDEPYIGLDAAGRSMFYDLLIEDFTDNPRLIIMSTHLIDEAAELFNEVLILQDGKLIIKENFTRIQEKLFKVKGKKQEVESFIKGQKVIHQSSFLNESQVIFEATVSKFPDAPSLTLEPVKLQELMIVLSKQYREETV